jgi:hypothetical protein
VQVNNNQQQSTSNTNAQANKATITAKRPRVPIPLKPTLTAASVGKRLIPGKSSSFSLFLLC